MGDAANPQKKSFQDDLSVTWDILKSLVFFLGLYLFFLGWLYLYFYFDKFGVSFSSIRLDVTSYYSYGFFALMRGDQLFIFCLFFLGAGLVYYNREKMRYAYVFILGGIFVFFIASYFITHKNARDTAIGVLKQQGRERNMVYFDFTEGFLKSLAKDSLELKLMNSADSSLARTISQTGSIRLLQYNNNYQLSLIYENDDSYFVIYNPNEPGSIDMYVTLFNIDKKNTNYATKLKF